MKTYGLYLVDMDDTLYEERQYVLSGFRVLSELASDYLGISPAKAFNFMQQHFDTHGREGVLDALLTAHGSEPAAAIIANWVGVYRNHHPDICLYPGVLDTLVTLRKTGACACIVTDGMTCMQKNKFAALGLAPYVNRVVYCHETGYPKPDPRCLDGFVRHGQDDAVLIGDRPDHDLALAANLGIDAIRVRTGRFKNQASTPWRPVEEIDAFSACFAS